MKGISTSERKKLLKNKNVLKLTDQHIVYTSDFKLKSVVEFIDGKNADEIFLSAGIDLNLFKKDYARLAIKRWRKKVQQEGKSAFKDEYRGVSKGAGRPKSAKNLTYEELLAVVEIQQKVLDKVKKMKALASKK